MRTIAPVLIVLALGVSGAMIGMSGFEDAWGAPAPSTTGAQEELDNGTTVNPNDRPIEGPVSSGESNIVGLITDGLSSLTGIAASVAVLPVTLINLGFPAWFALPIGSLVYIISGIGLIQFATNRRWV